MKWFFVSLSLLMHSITNAQIRDIPTGTWRFHSSFRETKVCEATEKYVYVSSETGLFRIDIQTQEMQVLNKPDGFQAVGISAMSYSKEEKVLAIGYSNGLIELLIDDRQIVKINGLLNKALQGDKSILHICMYGKQAIISTNFGILVVDLVKFEIRDSYTAIGAGGQSIPVFSTAISRDSIYAGLQNGIIRAKFADNVNLNDFNNWQRVYTGNTSRWLTNFRDSVYFAADSSVYRYYNGVVSVLIRNSRNTGRIKAYSDNIHIFRGGGIYSYGAGVLKRQNVNILRDGTIDARNRYWFCTGIGPAIARLEDNAEYSFEPSGPSSGSVFAMTKNGDNLFVSGGGVSNTFGNAYNPAGFYIYTPDGWKNNPASSYNTNLYDYTFVHYNPITRRNYVATHVNGMLEYRGLDALNRWDSANSTLQKATGLNFIRVSGVTNDKKGNIWAVNYGSPGAALHTMNRSGVWTAITLPTSDVKQLIIDQNGFKWMILVGGGILVYDDNGTPANLLDDRNITLTNRNGLISNDVTALSCDSTGYVWVGTNQGLNVFTNPSQIFDGASADRLIIRQNGEDGYLLGEETVNDICVDGGNRKWFATNNGVFLVEQNGQSVLVNYRTDNSPLPDNRVLCIGQIDKSGEVFFGTEKGIVSFRSDASAANESFGKVRVYPNPVRPGYTGPITIDGLAENAEVRITDAAGIMVYQTKANGGKATWNGLRLNGTKPASGVYYVFAINQDGTETEMAKFIFVP